MGYLWTWLVAIGWAVIKLNLWTFTASIVAGPFFVAHDTWSGYRKSRMR